MKSRIANSNIMKDSTAAIDIHTILFVFEDFLDLSGFDSSVVDGPSACLDGLRPGGGGLCSEAGPGKNGNPGGGVPEDVGGGKGAALELNGFPSLRKLGMLKIFGGIGPENRLFLISLAKRERERWHIK